MNSQARGVARIFQVVSTIFKIPLPPTTPQNNFFMFYTSSLKIKVWFINKIVALRNKRATKLFYKDIDINLKQIFFQFKLITSCSKWTGPDNYEKITQ